MSSKFHGRDILSILDLSPEDIKLVLRTAEHLKKKPQPDLLKRKILASCFFEPSTRTRLSFESAMLRLGGSTIGFSDSSTTSAKKGESLEDSMKIIGAYADVIVLRHPLEGSARLAAESTDTPVINAGDGANQHPTQTLLDLYTIKECQKKLEGLHVAIAGDLKYGRTAHSLAEALSYFGARIFFVCPEFLAMPEEICQGLKQRGIKFSFHKDLQEVLPKCDILYMTRIQKERFQAYDQDVSLQNYSLQYDMLKEVKKNFKIMHPLPKVDEIERKIDNCPYAYYFEQASNGIYVRQALLALILGKSPL